TLLVLRALASTRRRDALRVLLQMAAFRVVRAWNQTGQKWAGEPDIRRILSDPRNVRLLWAQAALTVVVANAWAAHRLRRHRVARGLLAYGSACALVYHMDRAQAWPALGAGPLALLRAARWLAPSDPLLLARTVYVTVLLQAGVCWTALRGAGLAPAAEAALAAATPLFLLLARPHSFGVFALFFAILALFPPAGTAASADGLRSWLRPSRTLVLFGLAHASFFALGSSNSLASLDLSNAYAGVAQYDGVQVGLLVFFANWAGPLWWALAAAAALAREHPAVGRLARRLSTLAVAAHLWQATALLTLSAVATLLRSHLFVWSVFSPRYLYQAAWFVAFYLGCGTVGGAVWLAAAAVA
ncbi:major facilitator super transporter protein, partial [Coemansia spiralis]